jgi:hypothetical protein
LAPILAAKGELEEKTNRMPQLSPLMQMATTKAKEMFKPKSALGLPEPDAIGKLTAIAIGKRNPTFKAVYSFVN